MDEAQLRTFDSHVAGASKRLTDIERRTRTRQAPDSNDMLLLGAVEELHASVDKLQVAKRRTAQPD